MIWGSQSYKKKPFPFVLSTDIFPYEGLILPSPYNWY